MSSWFLALVCASLGLVNGVSAQKAAVENGAIVFTTPDGAKRRLTSGPHDSEPALAPDGKSIAFLRTLPGKTIAAGSGEVPARELWLVSVDGTAKPRRLVEPRDDAKVERLLAGLQNPQFSPDGREIFFESAAWATSGAIHAVEVRTGRERFVVAGQSFAVVPRGEYAGCLIAMQHRYFLSGGSFDWYWLLRPDGREVGPIGENDDLFRELQEMPPRKSG